MSPKDGSDGSFFSKVMKTTLGALKAQMDQTNKADSKIECVSRLLCLQFLEMVQIFSIEGETAGSVTVTVASRGWSPRE